MTTDTALAAFRDVNFEWVRRLNEVWQDDPAHVPAIHVGALDGIAAAFMRIERSSPLGRVIVGSAGTGKTHLLGALRKVLGTSGWFVLVDMTDVRDFWETVLQGFLESLRAPLVDGRVQFQHVLRDVMQHLAERGVDSPQADYERLLDGLRSQQLTKIVALANSIITKRLNTLYSREAVDYQDVLRALLLLNAADFEVTNFGHTWLLGLELSEDERRACGFASRRRDAKHVVMGLSWLMSLSRPTLLALDQLDAIVGQYSAASRAGESPEQAAAQAILNGLGNGLLELERLSRTLSVLSCLEPTWRILQERVVSSVAHRFERPSILAANDGESMRRLIEGRLSVAYGRHNFTPPYPSYPFLPSAFEGPAGQRPPREVLMSCAQHRDVCVTAGQITELVSFAATSEVAVVASHSMVVEQRFNALLDAAETQGIITDEGEDQRLGVLIAAACRCAARELPRAHEWDVVAEHDFPSAGQSPALHARLRMVDHLEGGRERHYCFRALNRSHHIAYQNRLRQAMNTAGIRETITFRRLVMLRNANPPKGEKTKLLTQEFFKAGGRMVSVDEIELRRLVAIDSLLQEDPPGLDAWLRTARPASALRFLQESGFGDDADVTKAEGRERQNVTEGLAQDSGVSGMKAVGSSLGPAKAGPIATVSTPGIAQPHEFSAARIVFGHRMQGGAESAVRAVALSKHTAILASSGSGKTVLLRRIVEEAALLGVPSIVVDPGNDLARLGDAWPNAPAEWKAGDADMARHYIASTHVRVWTPGVTRGRPMNLAPLPDFTGLSGDELDEAVDMALAALMAVIPGGGGTAARRKGVLAKVLRYFAEVGAKGLDTLIEILTELPPGASNGDTQAGKLAEDMSNLLRAQRASNVLWRQEGEGLDPAELFGKRSRDGARTRISVINLMGLPNLEQQQFLVNALAMALFGWVKRNPAASDRPLHGLLILDEAKDFVPSVRTTACKDSLLRLVRQARKYGLGLIFATQEPQSIDHSVIANCSTQIYGKASSPPAIERMRSQMQERGSTADDVARLKAGQFYISTEESPEPVKTVTPMCLSWHPPAPLDRDGVLERALRD